MKLEQVRGSHTRLRLSVRPSGRFAAFAASILTAFLGLILGMLLVAIPAGTGPSVGRNLIWALIAMLTGATLWGAWSALREAFVRPAVVISDAAMTIVHPAVLKRPLELRWESIRAVAVSTPDDPALWDVKDLPLEVIHERGPLKWSAPQEESVAAAEDFMRAFVPLLDRDTELVPNFAIALNEPFDLSAVTSRRLLVVGFRKTLPGSKETLGFVASVRDPVLARRILEPTGLVRKLNWSDRALLEPKEEDVRRIRRTEHLVAFGIAYGGLVIAHRVWEMVSAP